MLVIVSLMTFACSASTKPRLTRNPPTEASTAHPTIPDDLRELARAVEEIPTGYSDPTHGKLVAALSLIARFVRADDPDAAQRIDELATKLMRSPPYELGHAELAADAIGEAVESFARNLSLHPDQASRQAYVAARLAHERISAAQPLRYQLHNVAAAMRSIANLAAITRGVRPLFARSIDTVHAAHDAHELRLRVLRASASVSELAVERSWDRASNRAAKALKGFADVLEVSPIVLDVPKWHAVIADIRYEALRLEQQAAISLDRTDHIKAGLAAARAGLDAIARVHRSSGAEHVIAAAGNAIDRIDENTAFVFQRAMIQEAFRLASDAFVVVAHGSIDCPGADTQ